MAGLSIMRVACQSNAALDVLLPSNSWIECSNLSNGVASVLILASFP